jgi:hypothetical protein
MIPTPFEKKPYPARQRGGVMTSVVSLVTAMAPDFEPEPGRALYPPRVTRSRSHRRTTTGRDG